MTKRARWRARSRLQRLHRWLDLAGTGLLAAALIASAACTSGASSPASPRATPTPAAAPPAGASPTAPGNGGITDPFAYCAQVGTIDAPDARYSGERVPTSIAEGIRRASGGAPSAPLEVFVRGTSWRCMDGKVFACTVGANLPCGEKADASRTPSAAVIEFCRTNPDAAVVPAAVTGRATVYQWRCAGPDASIVRQIFEADPRGFIGNVWYEIKPS